MRQKNKKVDLTVHLNVSIVQNKDLDAITVWSYVKI